MKRTSQHALFFAKVASFTFRAACAALVCAMACPVQGWAQWAQVQKLTPSDSSGGDEFGFSVAVSSDGSIMVVGAPRASGYQGRAYVFVKNGATWTQQQELTSSDSGVTQFGTSVAISPDGTTLVVGATDNESNMGIGGAGNAFVFAKNGAMWTQQAELAAPDGATLALFGNSVAASDSAVVVGAPQTKVGSNNQQGTAYVFVPSGGTWILQQELTASDGATGGGFGTSVAISSNGSTAFVSGGISGGTSGAVYVFLGNGSTWTQQQELTSSSGSVGEYLAVSGDGSTVVADESGAFVFVGNGATWTQQAALITADARGLGGFGSPVAISGDGSTVLAGSIFADVGNVSVGKAYVFANNGATWTQQQELFPSDGLNLNNYSFGDSVAVSGNGTTMLVGASFEEAAGSGAAGAAYVFTAGAGKAPTATTLSESTSVSLVGQSVTFTSSVIGYSTAGYFPTGTVTLTDNGSGLATVPLVNGQATYAAALSTVGTDAITALYSGDTNNQPSASSAALNQVNQQWVQLQELIASDGAANDSFGNSVAMSGNIALVGAPCHPATGSISIFTCGTGTAYVFGKNGGTYTQQAELTAPDGAAGDQFGYSVAIGGNLAVVGAKGHMVGSNAAQGAVYVYMQSGGMWTLQAEITAPDGAANDQFGWSVAISGNTAVVGAPQHGAGPNIQQGAAYVFGQTGGTWSLLTEMRGFSNQLLGQSVAISANTAVVGAPGGGVAYVFVQSGGTWTETAVLKASDATANDSFGYSVAVDGSTAVVGAPTHQPSWAAYVFSQSGGIWSQQTELAPDPIPAQFGNFVAVSGSTAVAGGPGYLLCCDVIQFEPGGAYVFTPSGGTWVQQTQLTTFTQTFTGNSAAVIGGTALVGVQGAYVGSNYQGAAYLFAPPVVTITGSPQQPLTTDGSGNFVAQVTITNTGNVTVDSLQVTSATLGSGTLLSAPAAITNLAPGASAVVTLTFPPNSVPSGATTAPLKLGGTYSVTNLTLAGNWALSFRGVIL